MVFVLALACTGGPPEPSWLEGCDCPEGDICHEDGTCAPPPASCAAVYPAGECELDALDEPCELDLCGLDDGSLYELEAECWTTDKGVERYVTCTAL